MHSEYFRHSNQHATGLHGKTEILYSKYLKHHKVPQLLC